MNPLLKSIIGLTLTLLTLSAARAQTPVTGYLEGEKLGLIHPDYTTGDNTTNKTKEADPDYFTGNRKDFYIDLDDPDFSGPGGGGDVTVINNVGSALCDDTIQACAWDDFAWSPRIGWVAFDGVEIQSTPPLDDTAYPGSSFPHITYDGFLNGFAWGDTTGWIALSACSGLDQPTCGTLPTICSWNANFSACQLSNEPITQNATEWGAFVDLTAQSDVQAANCEVNDQVACLADSSCSWSADNCSFEGTPRGRFFEGFSWSQHLGWIAFENASTTWNPDATEPDLNIDAVSGDHLWFPTEDDTGLLTWEDFAQDSDTGIDPVGSNLELNLDTQAPGDFVGCYAAPVNANFAQQGNAVDVFFANVGRLNNAPYGFCKYTLTGEVVNGGGLTFYIGDPDNNLPPEITTDPEQYREAITIYTFAGDYVEGNSSLNGDSSKLADGDDVANMTFTPRDVANNPIVPVRVGQIVDTSGGNITFEGNEVNWMRDVELRYSFQNNAYFDTVNPAQTPGNAPVVLSNTDPVGAGTTYSPGVDGTYPSGGQSTLLPTNNRYELNAVSFAPTSDTFVVKQIDMRVLTAELPAITTLAGVSPESDLDFGVDENTSLNGANPLNFSFNFQPPLTLTNGGLNDENMVVGQPVELSYDITNDSTQDIGHLAADHEFNFLNTGLEGFGAELLEFRNIGLVGAPDDSTEGQTDLASGSTRYAIINQTLSGLNNDVQDTVFFDQDANHHPTVYDFESDLIGTPSSLDSEGRYAVDGSFYGLGAPLEIDRGDFTGGAGLNAGNTGTPVISLTPVQIGGVSFTQNVEFELAHFYMAYRMENLPAGFTEFAVYEEGNPVSGIEIQNIGLNTTGLVSGGQVFEDAAGNRTLSTVSTAASASLQRDINRNVASLTRNVTPCEIGPGLTLSELSIDPLNPCVILDELNRTAIAYYQGDPDTLLNLGDATGTLTLPDGYRYTLILEGGADLFLRDNLANGVGSSLGMIVFDDEGGIGGNVYLDPFPTNMAGLLYAEGSVLSSPDGSTLYYGEGGNPTELNNQLYWQGKIASENTLGGAPNLVTPPGIICPNTIETLECAQRYDLDFLRRFATINSLAPPGDYSLNNGKFSGDGTCNDAIPECEYLGVLPTTIALNGSDLIDVGASKSADPVFIEPDARPIPLGFTKEIGLSQSGVVL